MWLSMDMPPRSVIFPRIPQGSYFELVLFNIFVIDNPNINQHSVPFLCAGHLKLVKVIEKADVAHLLQWDLDRLCQWRMDNMSHNLSKCFYIPITRTNNLFKCVYNINSVTLNEA